MEKVNEHLKEIGHSIFEAKSAYTIWKAISYSRSTAIVSEELVEKYVAAQNTAPAFFTMTERLGLVTFVISVLQPFDRDMRTHSFFKVDEAETKIFLKQNEEVLKALRLSRDKVFAHRDISGNTDYIKITIPGIDKLDTFFNNLFLFYNKLTSKHSASLAIFDTSTNDLLNEIERLFMNITRGEMVRKAEIDIKWGWDESSQKISHVFKAEQKSL
ncbi:MAG: hypothetical protein WAY88_00460 [Minisyncoccia bacterium]